MLKRFLYFFVFCVAFTLPLFSAWAGNIENSNSDANLEIDNTDVQFTCAGCDVEVTDTEINGLIWGESLGWVNLQPSDGGVFNTRMGVVSGNAWGSISGWVNFEGVFINNATGEFSGEAYSQNRGPITFECPGSSCVITTWRTYGCTLPDATNYDPTAGIDDDSCFIETVPGCMDPDAGNYNPLATEDDGSCQYPEDPVAPGCTDPQALNYNPLATVNDGSCLYDEGPGEGDNPGGGGDDPVVEGCTDPEANNYNQFANLDDASCLYGLDVPGCMDPDSPLFDPDATVSNPDACFIDFYGCMDPEALNFDPDASIHNNSCIYPGTEGCTDPLALNYNPNATISDGICFYDDPENGCTNPEALNYNPDATFDNGTCIFGIDEIDDEEGDDELDTDGDGIPDSQDPDDDNDGIPDSEDPDDDNDGIPDDEENDPIFVDDDEDGIPDILQGGEEILENLFDDVPGGVGKGLLEINRYIATRNTAARILATALLIGSLLQTIPFREGNLLFSYFSFYKTRRYWGTVYDAITKQPLDPAYVTLFDEAGQAIDTSITDIDGRYSFIVPPGKYFLSAQKTDYQFPSNRLKGKNYDELYSHLYFGGEVVIEKEDDVISRNIPMDPLRFNWNEYAKRKTKVTHFYRPWHRTLNILAKIIFVVGFIFAIWVFAVSPNIFSFIVLSLYIVTTVLKLFGLKAIPRGYVKDKHGFAVHFGVIRVYSESLHREVKHTIIGPKGHYLLLVPNGRYYMTVEQKLPDGTYKEVHKTGSFRVRKGYIAKKITIKADLMTTEDEKFDAVFAPQNKIA